MSDFVVGDMWKVSTVEAWYQSHARASRVNVATGVPGRGFLCLPSERPSKQSTSDICNTNINDYDALMLLAAA
jgi:hypothetical protein